MKTSYNFEGQQFGELLVIDRNYERQKLDKYHIAYYNCKCSCGKQIVVSAKNLKTGNSKSCGHNKKQLCSKLGKSNAKTNNWVFKDEFAYIEFEDGKNTIIDYKNYNKVKDYCWRINYHNRIVANSKNCENKTIQLSRILLDINEDNILVDHIDGNTLNNLESNLRKCNKRENNINIKKKINNTSGFTGVSKNGNKWKARINCNNKKITIGIFDTFNEAVLARGKADLRYYGEFSGLYRRKDEFELYKQLIKETADAPDLEESQEV